MISYDELTGRIIDLRQTRDQTNFEAGDLCWYAMEKMGANASLLAADTGYSAQHIRDLAKTSMIFHDPEDRRPREYIEWSHYKIASRTDQPVFWVDQAEVNAWSVRELQRQIKSMGEEEPDPFAEAKHVLTKVQKVIEAGGEAAEWLIAELEQFLSPSEEKESGQGLKEAPDPAVNTAGAWGEPIGTI